MRNSKAKTLTVQDLINKQRNPNYKGNKNKSPETGPLRPNKPAIYNTKNVSNPVIDKTVVDKINGVEKTQPWVPEY